VASATVVLALTAGLWCVLRFVGLAQSPGGFCGDEFRGAINIICLSEQGQSADGRSWPLFVPGAGDGLYTPLFLYFGALWTRVFGYGIASFRGISAFFTVLTILGVFFLARRATGTKAAFWAVVAASLSPWSFQFARIAWDPPLAPCCLIWSLYFWLGRTRFRSLLSGVLFSMALYAYPPMRVQAPLVLLLVWGWDLCKHWLRTRWALAFAGASLLTAAPLLCLTFTGELNRRGVDALIVAPGHLARAQGDDSLWYFTFKTFLNNLYLHFDPDFLFLTGDTNGRHSSQLIGELGFLDDLALVAGIAVLLLHPLVQSNRRWAQTTPPSELAEAGAKTTPWLTPSGLVVFGLLGYLAGLVPPSLCWQANPHALRALGSWPFLSLTVGAVLLEVQGRLRWTVLIAAALAVAQSVLILRPYYHPEPSFADIWFDASVKRDMVGPQSTPESRARTRDVLPLGYRYYNVAYRGATCESSGL